MRNRILFLTAFFCPLGASFGSDYGGRNLIDTPSARMYSDGQMTLNVAFDNYLQSYSVSYQAFPWLETTFRYSGLNDFFYWDRNLEAKVRLLEEDLFWPEVSVGLRDIVGTSVFGSEYVVANKKLGPLDLSFGMGWGRLAGEGNLTNPLTLLHDGFKTRDTNISQISDVGRPSVATWFRGEKVGFFGGVTYEFESAPVTLIAEYNPDIYAFETNNGRRGAQPSYPISLGLDWQIDPEWTLTASYQHGDAFGLAVSKRFDSTYKPKKLTPSPIIPTNIKPHDSPDWFEPLVRAELSSGVIMESARLNDEADRAEIALSRGIYQSWPDLINTAHTQASVTLPESVNRVDYLVKEAGMTLKTVRLPRLNTALNIDEVTFETDAKFLPPRVEADEAAKLKDLFEDKLSITAFIDANYHLFDPDNPFGYTLYAGFGAAHPIGLGWNAIGVYQVNLTDNLDGNTRVSDSVLPHVRSDVSEYLKGSNHGFNQLIVEKRDTLTSSLHYRAFGGILEQMYSGVGGEVLFMPHDSRFATSLSAAYAKQRDFDGGLGLRDYDVVTGHASLFWATPWYNYDAAVHVGRYLAKDVGATMEVRRTFDNGWSIGVWATLTDVPFDDFGEGSFDKGFYFQVPLGNQISGGVGSELRMGVRPIQRDGGARLEGYSGQLWWDTRRARSDVFLGGQ